MSGKSVIKRSSRSSNKKVKEVEIPSSCIESEKTSERFVWDINMRKQSTKTSTEGFSRKRKLHKTYIKGWNEDIAKNGFARCIIASCSFTSPDIASMQKHHKTCFAVVSNDENSTEECEGGLSASESQNSPFKEQTVVNSQNSIHVSNSSFQKWDHQIKTLGQAFCGNQDCNFVGMNLTDLENHRRSCLGVPNFSLFCCIHCRCGFSTKEDHLKHQKNCSVTFKLGANPKKIENLHFRVIKQKSKNSSEDHIIQPGPDLPKGQYRRRRAYRAEHKNSWALTLEKYKYVKCIYQNCYFIAMSLEDMIAHFGYCNGDGSFAKFICPYCNGRVTSEAVLLKHIERSHTSPKASIKDEPLITKNNEEPEEPEEPEQLEEPEQIEQPEEPEQCELPEQFEDPRSPETELYEEEVELSSQEQETNDESETILPDCRKLWDDQITEFGNAYCRKSLCNFMAPNIKDLEVHVKTCDGTPDFEILNCDKCRYRLPTKEDLRRHVPLCKDEKMKYSTVETNPQNETLEEDDFEIGPVLRQYEGKRSRSNTKKHKLNSISETPKNNSNKRTTEEPNVEEIPNAKHKPRKRAKKPAEAVEKNQQDKVKCGKCDFRGTKNGFVSHNLKAHVGLGWIEGEEPVDLNDEKLVIRLVKEAFRWSKKAACEKCDDVKRSVMGFVTHIQTCGKSEEEKNALKVQCPHCEGKYLKYSMSAHLKLCNPSPEEEEEKNETVDPELDVSGKRRSAIRAASMCQLVLNENDESEPPQENSYILYERGSERAPKLNSKLNNLWYKLRRENRKIPCRHSGCRNLSAEVREAKYHHYNCPFLPERVYMCELCDFYSVEESVVKSHVTTHRKYLRQRKAKAEDEVQLEDFIKNDEDDDEDDDVEEEEEIRSSDEELGDEPRKRRKTIDSDDKIRKKGKLSNESGKLDLDIESRLKQNFCRREKIDNIRGIQFYSNGLDMTLQEELLALERSETWPEFHTTLGDWSQVPLQQAFQYFPQLAKSVSVRFSGSENKWRIFERFNGDLIDGVPVMFTGGSIRSMSWCKISFKRMMEKTQRQYLAVTSARKLDYLKDIYDRTSAGKSTFLQIWDCGVLDDEAKDAPKLALGLIQKGGEIWDLAWFPNDSYTEGTEYRLRRLGLLATASEDGAVRVWSICDPSQLENSRGPPLYVTDPVVILKTDAEVEESCLQLSVTPDGVLAGGFSNGTVAVWNLKNISSPFCKKLGKCKIIRAHLVFHAHKTAITALSFCPSNSRYISTAGLDRFAKVWDLESPSVPVEQYNKDCSLDNIWTMNWPCIIHNFDDIVVNFNKGAVKFIKDILNERHQTTFAMEDPCLTLSFSDWLNALCAGSITGEVKLRLLKNFMNDQKRSQSTISTLRLEKLFEDERNEERGNDKDFPISYDDVEMRFGLVFKDDLGLDKGKPKKPEAHPEEFPIRAVTKIAFNPNFKSFTHVALGYNCGLIRIQQVKELQSAKSLKFFLEKTQRGMF